MESTSIANLTIVNQDLLKSVCQFIAHQCNCISKKGAGLSLYLFKKYPYANIYNDDTVRIPGTIIIRQNIINIMGQKYPGKPKQYETAEQRELWFKQCLDEISLIEGLKSIGFPYQIGCGLAGGNWINYYNMIKSFAIDNPNVEVVIYKL